MLELGAKLPRGLGGEWGVASGGCRGARPDRRLAAFRQNRLIKHSLRPDRPGGYGLLEFPFPSEQMRVARVARILRWALVKGSFRNSLNRNQPPSAEAIAPALETADGSELARQLSACKNASVFGFLPSLCP